MRKRLLGLVAAPLMLAQCDPGCWPVPLPPTTTTTTTTTTTSTTTTTLPPPAALDTIVVVETRGACDDPASLQVAFTNRSAEMNQMYARLRADGVSPSPPEFVVQGETVVIRWPTVGGAPAPSASWNVEVAAPYFFSGVVSAGTITLAGDCQPDPDFEMRGAPGCAALRFENHTDHPLSVSTAPEANRQSVPAGGFVDSPWDQVIHDRLGNPIPGAYAHLDVVDNSDEQWEPVAGSLYVRDHFCQP